MLSLGITLGDDPPKDTIRNRVNKAKAEIKKIELKLKEAKYKLRSIQDECNHSHLRIEQEWLGENGPGPEWYECIECDADCGSCFPPRIEWDKLREDEQEAIRAKYKLIQENTRTKENRK